MFAMKGTYDGSVVHTEKRVPLKPGSEVIVTFLTDPEPTPKEEPRIKLDPVKLAAYEKWFRSLGPTKDFSAKRNFKLAHETTIEERKAALNRLAGCIEGCTMTIEEAREERLAKI